jgi:hypothetical protein
MRVGAAVSGVEHHHRSAAGSRLFLESRHQELADSLTPKALADDKAGDLAAWVVLLDEVLDVERAEAGGLTVDLGDDHERGRVARDSLESLCGLFGSRRIAELAEQLREWGRVSRVRLSEAYGGGGPGGAWYSTYVVLLRPHEPP